MSATPVPTDAAAPGPVGSRAGWIFLSITRIVIGFYFFWAFIDKLFGLGFSTCRQEDGSVEVMCDRAWLSGARITEGYLGSSSGPFADFFADLGTQAWTDWPFMIGLCGIGLALMLGIGTRVGMVSAVIMLAMMWISHSWPGEGGNTTNPFVDDHIIMIVAIIAAVLLEVRYQAVGLGEWWKRLDVVQQQRWLI
ncbi:DoxX family membrane protein [Demequina sp. NBRC 110055]|uniref:DoxX family membrane protein n=1 Tax=Demequina sp. NBRC 110055 TaxID=1570344 RepID=UPI000A011201|nr:DoxX family membrane protein [Demequina sp. NBRC 110055]